jgi:hypothetical protein
MSALHHNQFFRHFLFGNNVSGKAGAEAIAQYVKAHPGTFETWYLAGNNLDAESIRIMCEAWVSSPALKALWLKRNPIHVEGARALAQLLMTHKPLKILDLDNCGLLDEGVQTLCEGLLHCPSLRHLYLGSNGIGPPGAHGLASVLAQDNCALESLFLSTNRLRDEGADLLAIGLRRNNSLQRLILSSNSIESLGVIALAEAISTHPNLRVVCFGKTASTMDMGELPNRMGHEGAKAIADMLRANPRIQLLSVVHNSLDASDMNLIAEAAASHEALLQLDMAEHEERYNSQLRAQLYQRLTRNVRALHGEDVSYKSFLRLFRNSYRNIPEVAHIHSIYRTADFTRQNRRQLVKRWPRDKIEFEEKN